MKREIHSRPPLARMRRIHERLSQGKPVTCKQMAMELETSAKTISRDIDYLRDNFCAPIEYNAQAHTFFYDGPVGEVLFEKPLVRARLTGHMREDGTAADFSMPLEPEPLGSLTIICERHGLRAECVLAAIVGETLADAMRIPRLMDTIVRAARVLAVDGREAA